MNNKGDETARSVINQSEPASEMSDGAPEFIYFYYINRKADHVAETSDPCHDDWDLRVFSSNNLPADSLSEQRIKDLIAAADGGKLKLCGTAMQQVILRHKSHMLFVWRDHKVKLRNVQFVFRGDAIEESHSFEDFSRMTISPDITVVTCINTRKDKDGGPLGNKSETFDVEFETDPYIGRLHNENTTNTGP